MYDTVYCFEFKVNTSNFSGECVIKHIYPYFRIVMKYVGLCARLPKITSDTLTRSIHKEEPAIAFSITSEHLQNDNYVSNSERKPSSEQLCKLFLYIK